jgi:Mn-dependent DtxR family transcriptional regulator
VPRNVELLQRLTRRQLEVLQAIGRAESAERGAPLKTVATALGVSAPSALDHMTFLEGTGLIVRRRGKSRLTPRGRSVLVEYQRHHRVAESLFGQFGLDPARTCAAAREIDMALSHRTVEALCEAQAHPQVCPHGQPIAPCHFQRESTGASHGHRGGRAGSS